MVWHPIPPLFTGMLDHPGSRLLTKAGAHEARRRFSLLRRGTGNSRGNVMRRSVTTKTIVITASILAFLSLLPVFGILVGTLDVYSYWLMSMAFFVLIMGNLLSDV